MTSIILRILAILVASYVTHVGVPFTYTLETAWVAFLVALTLAIINHTIKPVINAVTLPITVLTLGLFSLVINGAMVLLASFIVPGFNIPSILQAIYFAAVLAAVNWVLHIFNYYGNNY